MINCGQINIFVFSLAPIKHGGQSTHHKTSVRIYKIKICWSILENLVFENPFRGVCSPPLETEHMYAGSLKASCVRPAFSQLRKCRGTWVTCGAPAYPEKQTLKPQNLQKMKPGPKTKFESDVNEEEDVVEYLMRRRSILTVGFSAMTTGSFLVKSPFLNLNSKMVKMTW